MAKSSKPAFPSKPCPGCGALIHARSKTHEACGWAAESSPPASAKGNSKARKAAGNGRRKAAGGARISLHDIEAVKKLVDVMGAEKVQQLARVLAR